MQRDNHAPLRVRMKSICDDFLLLDPGQSLLSSIILITWRGVKTGILGIRWNHHGVFKNIFLSWDFFTVRNKALNI